MDLVLGVAVTGKVARLALLESAAGATVIDQSSVDVAERPVEILTETVAGTNRLLTDENHRLVATRLCWSDQSKADELRRALDDSGVTDVAVLAESEAATALLGTGRPGSAVLLVGDETATLLSGLPVPDDDDAPATVMAVAPMEAADATGTFDTLMARLGEEAGAPNDVVLVGTSAEQTAVLADQLRATSTMHVATPDDPTFALARGAAMAAGAGAASLTMAQPALGGDATTFVPPVEGAQSSADDEQLAYSQAGEYELLPVEPLDEYDGYADESDEGDAEDQVGPAPLSGRSLLISNAVVAFAVIGFASLAVAVAVTVRPTAASAPVEGHQNAQPGKFMPLLPTQQQAPVPPPPPEDPTAGFQGGTVPIQGVVPRQTTPGGTPQAPVPAPVAPGIVPAPVPLPVPVIIPFPGWSPGMPTVPTAPPTTAPSTTAPSTTAPSTTAPPTTAPSTTTPSTTTPSTTTPPTTTPSTTAPPTTTPTTVQPTTASTTAPPTTTPTTVQPTTPSTTPKPTTVAPTTVAPTTVAPTRAAPTTMAPQPTQQTLAPQPTKQATQQSVAPQPQTPAAPKPQTPAAPKPTSGGGASSGS